MDAVAEIFAGHLAEAVVQVGDGLAVAVDELPDLSVRVRYRLRGAAIGGGDLRRVSPAVGRVGREIAVGVPEASQRAGRSVVRRGDRIPEGIDPAGLVAERVVTIIDD